MKKKNQESYITLQEKLRKLESDYFATQEKLKLYGAKDSSENSDWILLNEKLTVYETQISWLKTKLAALSQEEDKIIVYQLLGTGEEKTVQLTSGEADPDQGKISRISPLGIALNEKKVGEIVEVKINPHKRYQVKIITVK